MSDAAWAIRTSAPDDGSFLADMLTEAVNWSPRWKRKSRARVLSAPDTARYVAGWPREGDLGVVAEAGGRPVGAAWLRCFPASQPGYGFVAADIPELTIGVSAGWRARGVGRELLRALAVRAGQAGMKKISLSVERKNFAQKLYLSEGFRVIGESYPGADTMVKDLVPGTHRDVPH